jgi:sialic acid synthase SpsE
LHVKIGDKRVGEGEPTYIIAELGVSFEKLDQARRSVDEAARAGADAIKIQTYRAETLVTESAWFPSEAGGTHQFEAFKKSEISAEDHRIIFAYAEEKGLTAFSTPSYFDDADLLEGMGVKVYKIGSDDLTNLPFIKYVAGKGQPVIMSTGMGTMAEVARAVDAVRVAGNEQLILLHCVSNYPIKDLSTVNLKAMESMRRAFGVPVGFSDHTESLSMPIAAVALGANVVERHFTISKTLPISDAAFSADPSELATIVRGIREVEKGLGDGVKRPAHTEERMRTETRKSVIARRDIRKGATIAKEDLIVKRPAHGLPPELIDVVIGRTAARAIKRDQPITWEDV